MPIGEYNSDDFIQLSNLAKKVLKDENFCQKKIDHLVIDYMKVNQKILNNQTLERYWT